METLFGIPIEQLMFILIGAFAASGALLAFVAARNRILLKMASRNVPRRKSQTFLVVLGLMLATLLFSASFATGDTLTNSLRVQAVQQLGEVDIEVQSSVQDLSGQPAYFEVAEYQRIASHLEGLPEVESVAPFIREQAPVAVPGISRSEPRVSFLGFAAQGQQTFAPLVDADGQSLDVQILGVGEVFVSEQLAEQLGVATGDAIVAYRSMEPVTLRIAGVFTEGASPSSEFSIVMRMEHLQALTGNEDRINRILISNQGDAVAGARHTNAVMSELDPILTNGQLESVPVKQDVLTEADENGNLFTTVFLLFAQFSVAAGILLIFLIFSMLAAERKRDLGIIRAVGAQSGHIVRLFTFEGTLYALVAAAVGSLLGSLVGWGMAAITAVGFEGMEFDLVYTFRWESVVIAFTLGMAVTFTIVLAASWRVGRLNVIRAMRDIPEPRRSNRSIKGLLVSLVLPIAGVALTAFGVQEGQTGQYLLGLSLVVIGTAVIAQRFGVTSRGAFTAAGVALLALWLSPDDWHHRILPFLPDMHAGIEMFFLSGVMLVLGGVWVVIFNLDVILAMVVLLFGRIRGLPPVLRTAMAHPAQERFRTGMTLAMVALVVFTLTVMSFITQSIGAAFEDTDRLSGGYHIQATVNYANPIHDIAAALEEAEGISGGDFSAIGGQSIIPIQVKQTGTSNEPVDFPLHGVDRGYTESVSYRFLMKASEYATDEDVWQALQQPGTAVIAAWLAPRRENYQVASPVTPFPMEGFWVEDRVLPDVHITVTNPQTGVEEQLRVIGVIEELAFLAGGVMTSTATVNTIAGGEVLPQTYLLRMNNGEDAGATAEALRSAFLVNGLRADVLADEMANASRANLVINNLLQGFMGLGLIVGIAALGVIAARSVVERRQQIGMMRAIGFSRGMVQTSFLLESAFVAGLGILTGIALGLGLSPALISSMDDGFSTISYSIPWGNILLIAGIAYFASLLTTFVPAQQAARVYPAEALRYE